MELTKLLTDEEVDRHLSMVNHPTAGGLLAKPALREHIAALRTRCEAAVPLEEHNRIVADTIKSIDAERTSFEQQVADLTANLAAMTQAVGLATTCVPSMEMDSCHPIEMMQQVCAALENLTQQLTASEQRVKELEEWQTIVIGSGHEKETVIRMAASEYTKTIVQCWKVKVDQLQATVTAQQKEKGWEVVGQQLYALEMSIREGCGIELNCLSNMGISFIEKAVRHYQEKRDQLQATVTAQQKEIGRLKESIENLLTFKRGWEQAYRDECRYHRDKQDGEDRQSYDRRMASGKEGT